MKTQITASTTTTVTTYKGQATSTSVTDSGVSVGYDLRTPLVRNPSTRGWRKPSSYARAMASPRYWNIDNWYQYEKTYLEREVFRTGSLSSVSGISPAGRPSHVSQSTRDRALLDCLLQVKDEKFNMALMLAEINKSVDLIATSLTRLYNGYAAARRGRWADVPRNLGCPPLRRPSRAKDAGSRWLEYQYGWMPLLSDISGAVDTVANGFVREPRISATRVIREDLPQVPPTTVIVGGFPWDSTHNVSGFRLVKVRLDFKVDGVAADMSRFGLLNPLAVAWELVPFSFLVDWVLPIGDFLNALDATSGLTFIGGSETLYWKQQGTSKGTCAVKRPDFNRSIRLSAVIDDFDLQRSAIKSVRVPLPSFKSPVSVGHAANAVALFSALHKR